METPASADPGGGLPEQHELHPSLLRLQFLLGRWEGAGVVGYPTIESANFGQEIVFQPQRQAIPDLHEQDVAAGTGRDDRPAARHRVRLLAAAG